MVRGSELVAPWLKCKPIIHSVKQLVNLAAWDVEIIIGEHQSEP